MPKEADSFPDGYHCQKIGFPVREQEKDPSTTYKQGRGGGKEKT